MAPSSKARAAGVSASSFLDLKAELAKHETDFAKNKAAGKDKYIVGGVKRPDKKPTVWARQNKGVAARSSRDVELEAISRPTLESARAALERKAKIYEKLRKGQTGGLDEKQYDSLLVDFDQKALENQYESDSDDVDESLTVPQPPEGDDDPIVEYEDEFGRLRSARRSEVPRDLAPPVVEEDPEDDPYLIHNPTNHFPTFEPSEERVASITAAASEEANPLETHYDASKEVRAKGAAYYSFSADEETRRREMEELKTARGETVRTRQEVGAVDVKPGEVEGMVMPAVRGEDEGVVRSRAMEKRKRDLEERRRLVDAKRRKVKGGGESSVVADETASPTGTHAKDAQRAMHINASSTAQEARADTEKRKQNQAALLNNSASATFSTADDFLAALERDVLTQQGT